MGKRSGTTTAAALKPSRNGAGSEPAKPDERLAALRKEMEAAGVAALIVPSEDPHQSEYSAACFERRQFISRFTGSAGSAVVTQKEALLWTDGRYFLQAEKELGPEWRLMRAGMGSTPEIPNYLAEALPSKSRVGIDPQVHSASSARALKETLSEAGHQLVSLEANLVDRVWGAERPAPPAAPMRVHAARWAGDSVAQKLASIRKAMAEAEAHVLVVADLAEVCWLFNVRGGDVDFNPVTVSFALVCADSATLYLDARKVGAEVAAHLQAAAVEVKEYEEVWADLAAHARGGRRVWASPAKVSLAIFDAVEEAQGEQHGRGGKARRKEGGKDAKGGKGKGKEKEAAGASAAAAAAERPAVLETPSPIAMAKAVKNAAELDGMREAHLRDAAALAAFFCWLEAAVAAGEPVTEASAADRLLALRAQQEGFFEPSFPTIAGEGANGAVIHYRPVEGHPDCRAIGPDSMLLLDSGGQFDCGTTDVTRTVHLGQPSAWQRECFTRVLQGHIGLDTAVFPEAIPGFVLDAYARRSLWDAGLDYRHGTGHGVGAALNVHEGPLGISPRFGNMTGLVAGMVVSNEPGYYEDGAFGIRIENLEIIRVAPTASRFGGNDFLGFERLTMVPIQAKMIDFALLTEGEARWLDDYHAQVLQKVSPRVKGAPLEWLKVQCAVSAKERRAQALAAAGAGAAAGKAPVAAAV